MAQNKVVHWASNEKITACGKVIAFSINLDHWTTNKNEVTCKNCLVSRRFPGRLPGVHERKKSYELG